MACQRGLHPLLHKALDAWLTDRKGHPGAATLAVFLNRRGDRLSTRAAYDALTAIAEAAGIHTSVETPSSPLTSSGTLPGPP